MIIGRDIIEKNFFGYHVTWLDTVNFRRFLNVFIVEISQPLSSPL